VTRSGRGIGREIALSLAKSGAAVAITGRSKSEIEQSTKDVLALGDKVKAVGIVADGYGLDAESHSR
jgi:NAD(P)-dependent dehydrogenase (short-subunit alcohol dehydrogenase family)